MPRAFLVVDCSCRAEVGVAVDLDGELGSRRVEVEDVRIDAVLTSEFDPELLISQVLPQSLLGCGCVRAQRRPFGAFSTSVEVLRHKKPPPHPLLGKEGEERQHAHIQTFRIRHRNYDTRY